MRDKLSASRMAKVLRCPRSYYWAYECGLRSSAPALALRFGTAWHNAMEARWKGAEYGDALAGAVGPVDGVEFSERDIATLAGLLSGYYARYEAENIQLHPEVEFCGRLAGVRGWDIAGKIDGLGSIDGRLVVVEHKTTSESLEAVAPYWERLRFNSQLYQYVGAARAIGWDVTGVIYDVTRKPSIYPRKGESDEQFGQRLADDTQARPGFYFARREIAILDQDLATFAQQRLEIVALIRHYRKRAKNHATTADGWPRNVEKNTCGFCEYAGFCLQNIDVNLEAPPAGFAVMGLHPELNQEGE